MKCENYNEWCIIASSQKTQREITNENAQSIMSAESDHSDAHREKFWDVQAILAERSSSYQSGREVLVAWKPCWIPIENVPQGPILKSFRKASKACFKSSIGKIILPVEPDTALADDVAAASAWAEKQIIEHRARYQESSGRSGAGHRERVDWTPKKTLGSVAMDLDTEAGAASSATTTTAERDRTPRKQLNSVAKRRNSRK
jgi:hypothetical protein